MIALALGITVVMGLVGAVIVCAGLNDPPSWPDPRDARSPAEAPPDGLEVYKV
jgi:hypothetical protein